MKAALLLLLLVAPAASLNLRNRLESCDCIDWKAVYDKHNVRCGQGYELGQGGAFKKARAELPAKVPSGNGFYDEFCTRMYMQISFQACFNKKFGTPSEQWCYVSAQCEGAEKVEGTDVAIKTCSHDDHLMNNTGPEELNRLAGLDHLEIGLFGKLSYNMEPEKWSAVEAASGLTDTKLMQTHTMETYYGLSWTGPHEKTSAATKKLEEVKASGVPTIFDADNGHGGGAVVEGPRVYAFMPLTGQEGLGYVCVEGCFGDRALEARHRG